MEKWTEWARRWLSGEDRSKESAKETSETAGSWMEWGRSDAAWAAEAAVDVKYPSDVKYAAAAAIEQAAREGKNVDLLEVIEKICG